MKPVLAALLFALACAFAEPAVAQNDGVGVPIVKAPYHLPVFTNEYVSVLKMFIPPGRNSGYKIHTEGSVSINVVPADIANQNLASYEVSDGERSRRVRVTYAACT